MNITYCWTSPSGYLASCIAELAKRDGVNVTLIHWEVADEAPFSAADIRVNQQHVLSERDRNNFALVKSLVVNSHPDVVFIVGWSHPPYVKLVYDGDLQRTRFVIGADTPIRFDWRQQIARLKIGSLLRKVDAVCVPGERGFQVMRYWKVPGHKISKLFYGIDYALFSDGTEQRWTKAAVQPWPKQFVFAGRYVHVKGVDLLLDAYKRYRNAVTDPWRLSMCGVGPMASLLNGVEGVDDHGFMQPAALKHVFDQSGVFVLPSRQEPWGQVIVEAAAAGLPVICTQTCGASAEVVRDYHSGLVVPPESVGALTEALVWMHEHSERLPAMGRAGQNIASAFAATRWAENQAELAKRLCGNPYGL
jgi:glycosyltransferase involved in cell wall biosynthesis